MILRQRKTKDPCEVCRLHQSRCICHLIPSLNLQTRLSLIVHYKELKRTTNTGQLAIKSLVNSEMIVRGVAGEPVDLTGHLSNEYRTLLLYPSNEAQELTTEFIKQDPRPIHLLVPDGNWRQASKVHYRHRELDHIPRVMMKLESEPKRLIRKETTENGMATLQAIAEALGVIEGAEIREQLNGLYLAKLAMTLKGRGISI